MRIKEALSTAVLATLLAGAGPLAALATTERPEAGGTWEYGYSVFSLSIYSDYTHDELCHGSSVKSGDRNNRSQDIRAGEKSHAGLGWVGTGDERHYFFRVC